MATQQPTESTGVFHLPITGKGRIVAHALVADDDFTRDVLLSHKWNLHTQGYVYGKHGERVKGLGRRRTAYLHVIVFTHYHGSVPQGMEIDHADRNKLNCLPGNLRAVTHLANILNRGRLRNNTSGFIGVYWHKDAKRWYAQLRVNGARVRLGSFATARLAADAVNEAYRKYHPDAQVPNPPDESVADGVTP